MHAVCNMRRDGWRWPPTLVQLVHRSCVVLLGMSVSSVLIDAERGFVGVREGLYVHARRVLCGGWVEGWHAHSACASDSGAVGMMWR